MAGRAVELLNLPKGYSGYILDVGCGSGLSGEVLDEEGHIWVGFDISPAMLEVALDQEATGDLFLQDAGQGIAFRPGTFDGCISISVLQWLCNADKASHHPKARLTRFFSTLYSALRRGARAIFQFYPENDDQVQLIMGCAVRCGFEGGLVVDYPNSKKAKKFYLCLFAGQEINGVRQQLPTALGEDEEGEPDEHSVQYTSKKYGHMVLLFGHFAGCFTNRCSPTNSSSHLTMDIIGGAIPALDLASVNPSRTRIGF